MVRRPANRLGSCAQLHRPEESHVIVVVARIKGNPEKRDELIGAGQKVAAASRQEAGCIGYRLYEDTESANDFVVVEEWEDQAALKRHFGTDHIAEFMQAIPATLVAPPDIQFHTIESTMTLEDVTRG